MSRWLQDPGHGGSDPGAQANGLVEKVLNLEAAIYVRNRLKELGIASDMTRTSDVTLTNKQRTDKVRQYDKCISHHFNAGGGNGFESIHSIHADGKFENALVQDLRNAKLPVRPRAVYTRQQSDGRDWYFMHRETGRCRVTIVEYDFLDGPNASKLKDKKYRESLYECVVRAICREEGKDYYAPGESKNVKPTGKLYKVQVGAFANKDNADRLAAELKKKGFPTYIVHE